MRRRECRALGSAAEWMSDGKPSRLDSIMPAKHSRAIIEAQLRELVLLKHYHLDRARFWDSRSTLPFGMAGSLAAENKRWHLNRIHTLDSISEVLSELFVAEYELNVPSETAFAGGAQ
jgi:hypothetical protein